MAIGQCQGMFDAGFGLARIEGSRVEGSLEFGCCGQKTIFLLDFVS